jgi:hypothetical protein
MKSKIIMICAVAMFCCLSATAQNPFKDLTKNDPTVEVTFKGQSPTIVDFLTSYLSISEDELRGSIVPEWEKYLKNESLSDGVTFVVDQKNGYIRYEKDYDIAYPDDKSGEKSIVEFCYWNCADGTHKLFGENVYLTQNKEPIFTEFSGMYIYAYDNATKKLYMIDQDLLGLGEDTHGEVTFALPRQGKDIEVFANEGSKQIKKKLVWNGKGFNLK